MVTTCVSPDCVMLLLAPDEGLSVQGAVRLSLQEAGLLPWKDMEAELYESPRERLLIVRPLAPLCRLCCAGSVRLRRSGGTSGRKNSLL